ncbi:hypothetical protein BD779DRAFT_1433158 [Infundibulicybe gibba]|nr:hypothetical protein BD779DRAFT_1433158 [Infundibulicybe gibba]
MDKYNLGFLVAFSEVGSTTATMLVRAAGLDPLCATGAEMDALDLRFACRHCTRVTWGKLPKPKVGYPWKSAVCDQISRALLDGNM